jgi:hypothetical protein
MDVVLDVMRFRRLDMQLAYVFCAVLTDQYVYAYAKLNLMRRGKNSAM